MMRAIGMFYKPASGGPSVVIAATKLIDDVDASVAYAWVQVDSDGDLKSSITSASPTVVYETWLDAGLNSEVWVAATATGTALTTGSSATGATRLACTSDHKWGYTRSINGISSGTVTLDFYDAASGGTLLDSQVVTLLAERGTL